MTVEQAIPREDGTVVRRVYEDGQHTDTIFDTDEMLLEARASEEESKIGRLQRVLRPLGAISERVIGSLDASAEAHAKQLAAEVGSHTLLEHTIEGWRRSKGGK